MALLCDKMRIFNPASDPEGDYDYASGSEEEPEIYIINEVRVTRKSRARKRRTRRTKRKASRRQQKA
jgi:hypothetical protein